ncbi:MAG: aldo/keto reductase [Alphaproteobacteria bacterium]|nr:aldo/keto reductase [Alphaproteobacteria bacterium]
MKYLDMQGAKLPALGFGTWQLQGNECGRAVRAAIEIGYRHIDTAQIYENEAEVGRAIAGSAIARKEFFVTTKIWTANLSPGSVAASMEDSLARLRMDYVDLLLIHWPNPEVPLAGTLKAMEALMRNGKTKAIGVSNFTVAWMRRAVEEHGAPVACNQVEYHVLLSQRAVLEYARAHGITVTAYGPLARGKLTNNPVLAAIGKKYGKTANQVALRWLIEQDVAAIPKAARKENARENFAIFDFALSEDDHRAIAALANNTRLINPVFAPQWDAA